MHNPKISVIIPTFLRLKATQRALQSVADQSYTDFEVIVVDDGSPNPQIDCLSGCGIERLKFLRHTENRGPAAARNTGIDAAKGEYIAFLDSDDAWKPTKLALQIEKLAHGPKNVSACATGYCLHKDDRIITVSLDIAPERFRREILFGCTISPGSTLIVKRSVFDAVGRFDESLRRLEDWDWLLRFSRHYDIAFVPEPLAEIHLETSRSAYILQKADPVLAALAEIKRKHLPLLKVFADRMRLRSALLVESAAHMHRIGRPLNAVGYVIIAYAVYPFRNAEFFRTLWRSAASLVRR